MVRKVVFTVVVVLVGLLAIAGVGVYLAVSEPMDDMRLRADALHLPSDFVLVGERYSAGAMGLFGSRLHLVRSYHASWPGACDSLRTIQDRSGEIFEMARTPRELTGKLRDFGAWYPAGWGGLVPELSALRAPTLCQGPRDRKASGIPGALGALGA